MSHGHTSDCFHLTGRAHGQDRKALELSTVTVPGVVGVASVGQSPRLADQNDKAMAKLVDPHLLTIRSKEHFVTDLEFDIACRRCFRMELHTKFLTIDFLARRYWNGVRRRKDKMSRDHFWLT
jgi:hypothetical protein